MQIVGISGCNGVAVRVISELIKRHTSELALRIFLFVGELPKRFDQTV